jgi:hypothetical protein
MSNDATKQLAAMANNAGIAVVVDEDAMPVVKLEGDLNVTGRRLGEIVARLDLFCLNGEFVFFDHKGQQQVMTDFRFRTWINDFVITATNFDKKDGAPIPLTMDKVAAATILMCENFRRGVRELAGINHVRCPVIREDGTLELLPWGYDEQTMIYTVPGGLEYGDDLDWEAAKGRLAREFGTFPITDDRSMAVQVAAMLALYIRHLPGGTGLRPGILWYANKPGSGKSVLAKACLYPVLGRAAAAKMKKNEDLDKELEAFCRAAVPYIFLDNIYGGIQSASIDQLLTSEESTGRAMGGHGIFTAKNTALLLATGNQIDLNDDALRRFLLVDLFEKGIPEERKVDVPLDDARMRSEPWRVAMLEALWALVKHWHESGMQRGSVVLPSFEAYSLLLGGIVEAAGYVPPFAKAQLPDAKSPGRAEFEDLLAMVLQEMGTLDEKDFTLEDLCRLARSGQLYQRDVGTLEDGKKLTVKVDGIPKEHRGTVQDMGYMSESHASAFGKRMTKEIGTEPVVNGRQIQFGKRKQARRAIYTVKVMG